jgi:hypothetical protein
MALDHEAIYKAYSSVVRVDDSQGAFDKDGNKVTLVQSNIDTARTELNTAAAAVKYKSDRQGNPRIGTGDTVYLPIGEQLDLLYKDIVAGTVTTSGGFASAIKATKDKYPKPS